MPSQIGCVVSVGGFYETELDDQNRIIRTDTRELVTDPWAFGPVVIETPRVFGLPEPVPCGGMQGSWRLDGTRVPPGTFERVRDQIAAVTAAESRTA